MLTPLSPLLKDFFQVSFMMQSSDVTVISLPDLDVNIARKMMTYIYAGTISSSSTRETE